ncbi:MAG: hypothetical protein NTX59_13215 [Elusimicrobia bacterium]|nr:hypothetical protein [Elusimicrobiota bacterium]
MMQFLQNNAPAIQQGIHDLFYGSPEEKRRKEELQQKQEQHRQSQQQEYQRRHKKYEEARHRKLEADKEELLGDMNGVSRDSLTFKNADSTELAFKDGDDVPKQRCLTPAARRKLDSLRRQQAEEDMTQRHELLDKMTGAQRSWCRFHLTSILYPSRPIVMIKDDYAAKLAAYYRNKRRWDKRCGGPSALSDSSADAEYAEDPPDCPSAASKPTAVKQVPKAAKEVAALGELEFKDIDETPQPQTSDASAERLASNDKAEKRARRASQEFEDEGGAEDSASTTSDVTQTAKPEDESSDMKPPTEPSKQASPAKEAKQLGSPEAVREDGRADFDKRTNASAKLPPAKIPGSGSFPSAVTPSEYGIEGREVSQGKTASPVAAPSDAADIELLFPGKPRIFPKNPNLPLLNPLIELPKGESLPKQGETADTFFKRFDKTKLGMQFASEDFNNLFHDPDPGFNYRHGQYPALDEIVDKEFNRINEMETARKYKACRKAVKSMNAEWDKMEAQGIIRRGDDLAKKEEVDSDYRMALMSVNQKVYDQLEHDVQAAKTHSEVEVDKLKIFIRKSLESGAVY